jgi:hypothetical protein
MSHRDNAVELLQHFFALALGKRSVRELPAEYSIEIAEIVDEILLAAKEVR